MDVVRDRTASARLSRYSRKGSDTAVSNVVQNFKLFYAKQKQALLTKIDEFKLTPMYMLYLSTIIALVSYTVCIFVFTIALDRILPSLVYYNAIHVFVFIIVELVVMTTLNAYRQISKFKTSWLIVNDNITIKKLYIIAKGGLGGRLVRNMVFGCLVLLQILNIIIIFIAKWTPKVSMVGYHDCTFASYKSDYLKNFKASPDTISGDIDFALVYMYGLPLKDGIVSGIGAFPEDAPLPNFNIYGEGPVMALKIECDDKLTAWSSNTNNNNTTINSFANEISGNGFTIGEISKPAQNSFSLDVDVYLPVSAVADVRLGDGVVIGKQTCRTQGLLSKGRWLFNYETDEWKAITAGQALQLNFTDSNNISRANSESINANEVFDLIKTSTQYKMRFNGEDSEGIVLMNAFVNAINSTLNGYWYEPSQSAMFSNMMSWATQPDGYYYSNLTARGLSAALGAVFHQVYLQYDPSNTGQCLYSGYNGSGEIAFVPQLVIALDILVCFMGLVLLIHLFRTQKQYKLLSDDQRAAFRKGAMILKKEHIRQLYLSVWLKKLDSMKQSKSYADPHVMKHVFMPIENREITFGECRETTTSKIPLFWIGPIQETVPLKNCSERFELTHLKSVDYATSGVYDDLETEVIVEMNTYFLKKLSREYLVSNESETANNNKGCETSPSSIMKPNSPSIAVGAVTVAVATATESASPRRASIITPITVDGKLTASNAPTLLANINPTPARKPSILKATSAQSINQLGTGNFDKHSRFSMNKSTNAINTMPIPTITIASKRNSVSFDMSPKIQLIGEGSDKKGVSSSSTTTSPSSRNQNSKPTSQQLSKENVSSGSKEYLIQDQKQIPIFKVQHNDHGIKHQSNHDIQVDVVIHPDIQIDHHDEVFSKPSTQTKNIGNSGLNTSPNIKQHRPSMVFVSEDDLPRDYTKSVENHSQSHLDREDYDKNNKKSNIIGLIVTDFPTSKKQSSFVSVETGNRSDSDDDDHDNDSDHPNDIYHNKKINQNSRPSSGVKQQNGKGVLGSDMKPNTRQHRPSMVFVSDDDLPSQGAKEDRQDDYQQEPIQPKPKLNGKKELNFGSSLLQNSYENNGGAPNKTGITLSVSEFPTSKKRSSFVSVETGDRSDSDIEENDVDEDGASNASSSRAPSSTASSSLSSPNNQSQDGLGMNGPENKLTLKVVSSGYDNETTEPRRRSFIMVSQEDFDDSIKSNEEVDENENNKEQDDDDDNSFEQEDKFITDDAVTLQTRRLRGLGEGDYPTSKKRISFVSISGNDDEEEDDDDKKESKVCTSGTIFIRGEFLNDDTSNQESVLASKDASTVNSQFGSTLASQNQIHLHQLDRQDQTERESSK